MVSWSLCVTLPVNPSRFIIFTSELTTQFCDVTEPWSSWELPCLVDFFYMAFLLLSLTILFLNIVQLTLIKKIISC